MTTNRPSLWRRIVRWFRPPTETYDSRGHHPEDGRGASLPLDPATDPRRHGGSNAIGS
jgi:hypothetical protein